MDSITWFEYIYILYISGMDSIPGDGTYTGSLPASLMDGDGYYNLKVTRNISD